MTASKHPTRGGKTVRGIAARAKSLRKGSAAAARKSDKPLMLSKPLVSQFFDPKGFVIVDRVAERFGMSKQQFAETIGVKPETVYRVTRVSAPKTQARATEMLEIVGRITGWAGGEKQAMAWYRAEPIAAFGGRTAESLVKEGKAAAVRDYLDHIATGGFA
jgi:ribosome-binding protein aMBF1 (putative translation factor)